MAGRLVHTHRANHRPHRAVPLPGLPWRHAVRVGPFQNRAWPWPVFLEAVALSSCSVTFLLLLTSSSLSLLLSQWFSREAWALCAVSVCACVRVCVCVCVCV